MPKANTKSETVTKVTTPRISKLERLTLEIEKAKAAEETKRLANLTKVEADLVKAEAAVVKATEKRDQIKELHAILAGKAPLVTDGVGEAEATFTAVPAEEV